MINEKKIPKFCSYLLDCYFHWWVYWEIILRSHHCYFLLIIIYLFIYFSFFIVCIINCYFLSSISSSFSSSYKSIYIAPSFVDNVSLFLINTANSFLFILVVRKAGHFGKTRIYWSLANQSEALLVPINAEPHCTDMYDIPTFHQETRPNETALTEGSVGRTILAVSKHFGKYSRQII